MADGLVERLRGHARHHGRRAADSHHLDALGRLGLTARGVVYVLIGVLALRLAGAGPGESPDEEASTTGAVRAVADGPFGTVLLAALVLGLVGYALWRLSEAAGGHREDEGWTRTRHRLQELGRVVVYAVIASTAVQVLLTGAAPDQEEQTDSVSALVMEQPLGRLVVGGAGLAVGAAGLYLAGNGARQEYMETLHTHRMGVAWTRAAHVLGLVGYVARGLVFLAVGVFVVRAAVTFTPQDATGFDGALRELLAVPAGTALVGTLGGGLLVFGLFSLLQARWRET